MPPLRVNGKRNGSGNQQASPAPIDPLNQKVIYAKFRVAFEVIT